MSEKWTPGPWGLDTVVTNNGQGSCHRIGPFPSGGGYGRETYACVYADGMRIGIDDTLPVAIELRAVATLMRAAPDLYAALEELVNAAAFPASNWPSLVIDALPQARAALHKARGDTV